MFARGGLGDPPGAGPSTVIRSVRLVTLLMVSITGCAGAARVQLAAADAIEAASSALTETLREYDADLDRADTDRERAATFALVERFQSGSIDAASARDHAEAFLRALQRIQEDRRTAWKRYRVALDQVDTLRDIGRSLRRFANDVRSLNDEARRFAFDLARSTLRRPQDPKAKATDR